MTTEPLYSNTSDESDDSEIQSAFEDDIYEDVDEDYDGLVMPEGDDYTSIEKIVAANPGKRVMVVKAGWTNDYCFCVDEFTGTVKAEGKTFLNGRYRSEAWYDRRHKCFRIYEGPSTELINEYYDS